MTTEQKTEEAEAKQEAAEVKEEIKETREEVAEARKEGDTERVAELEATLKVQGEKLDTITATLKTLAERPFHPAPAEKETEAPAETTTQAPAEEEKKEPVHRFGSRTWFGKRAMEDD